MSSINFFAEFIAKYRRQRIHIALSMVLLIFASQAFAQSVTTPEAFLGFKPTDDRTIADWSQISGYFAKLDSESPRVKIEQIGKTTLGKPQFVAFISSPENISNLSSIKALNSELMTNPAKFQNKVPDDAKMIVSISCSIHSTEIVASQMSMILAHNLATAEDEKTKNILDNTVLLLIPSSNPDGIDIVANWYRKTLGTKYEGSTPPELYHHYAGHDNNRDWFMLNLVESRNITDLYWRNWYPQIVYDVHQQGSTSSRMTIPPFFDPPNPRIPPIILRQVGLVGYNMAADLSAAGVKGVTTNAVYDTWWHGGFRSAPYYHNSVGILTEAASASLMTPVEITREQLQRQSPARGFRNPLETSTSFPEAWEGGTWGPRDIAHAELTTSMSLLELASKFRGKFLSNALALAESNLKRDKSEPIAFFIPSKQGKNETLARMLDILMWQGMEVRAVKKPLTATKDPSDPESKVQIESGGFVVIVNQVQKNNVLSLFEKQTYPHRIAPNGEAEVPYDVAGWTLPLQMGIESFPAFATDVEISGDDFPILKDAGDARSELGMKPSAAFSKHPNPLSRSVRIGLYQGFTNSMDEGWTRLVLDNHQIPYRSLSDSDFRENRLDVDVLILPSQSEGQIVRGNSIERYPLELTGGITEEGVNNLKSFVENGGRLVCLDDSCEMVINRFGLGMKNSLRGMNRKEFYCPGSILSIDVDTSSPISKGMNEKTAAYFINSAAYEITDTEKIQSIAKYAEKDALLSGWIYGEEKLNGKTAIARAEIGKGDIILFGFRPQHRGQTYGTFPFIFNALEK
ncbi:MAG: M14 family metallopeptidase [Pyrinomonadaceae bacterium]